MHFTDGLHLYQDREARSAAMNMAIDEALFECAAAPSLRFYGWERPSISFGYFVTFAVVAHEMERRDIVRRWTGGGIVFHGTDLTYSFILPRRNGAQQLSSRTIYAQVHEAMRTALPPRFNAHLAGADAPNVSTACFANPVAADLLVDGRKIAGAAQRRTRAGLLQQGSIQCDELPRGFEEAFAAALCAHFEKRFFTPEFLRRARTLAEQKYGTAEWLRQR